MTMEIKELIGKTLTKIENNNDEELVFYVDGVKKYRMYHTPDCCESVMIEDIIGSLDDLVGSPILKASEDTFDKNPEGIEKEYQDSFTWTFYNISTIKGTATIRWYGESNGYYSESVDFEEII